MEFAPFFASEINSRKILPEEIEPGAHISGMDAYYTIRHLFEICSVVQISLEITARGLAYYVRDSCKKSSGARIYCERLKKDG